MKEGFLFGGGLVIVGLALELSVGPVVWEAFAWPVNGIVFGGFLAVIAAMFWLREKVWAFQFLGTRQAAIPAMVYAVVLTIIMGVTRQTNLSPGSFPKGEGSLWLNHMLTFWPFVLIYVYVTVNLGLVILRQIRAVATNLSQITSNLSLLPHLGLFLALTAATLGNADMQRVKMITAIGEPEWRALSEDGTVKEMPMAIELKRFIMETYDDGMPKRFASEIQILTESGKSIEATVDVNKPYKVDGWMIYQYGYDTQMGAQSRISTLELVSDPWLPLVYTGFYLMLAGALLLLAYTRWSYKRLVPIAALVAVALACVSYLMPIIRSTNLVPALQSPWFTPHILVYIVCYSLMGVAAVIAVYSIIRHQSSIKLVDNLVYIGLTFMTFGMLFGAFWAKEAWGHYWSWDPKETWAAITWLSYLVYIHYRQMPHHKPRLALWMVIVSFMLLQMCWWGINYLPAAKETSVHTYAASF
ncbi:MAG: cytochrome c biogenesis protein CcsA [Prevotella sp.]|nr:cytochrome c biogenesis protein CcsA [Prevotella sp.]